VHYGISNIQRGLKEKTFYPDEKKKCKIKTMDRLGKKKSTPFEERTRKIQSVYQEQRWKRKKAATGKKSP